MKQLIFIALLIVSALMISCANTATRYSLDPEEGVYSFNLDTTKDQRSAYYLAEEWLSTNIRNANNVITLRQPDTGTLIANPSMEVPVSLITFWCDYTLRIMCKDNQVITKFTLGKLENGTYPPRDAMPGIQAKFSNLSNELREHIENN